MALKDEDREQAPDSERPEPEAKAAAESQPPPPAAEPAAQVGRPAPLWVVPAYVMGLILVYLGERVLEPMPTAHYVATAIGLGAVTGATIVRFMPKFRVGGERSDIEKLLGVLSAVGVVALAVYFVGSDFGWEKTGLSALAPETGERVRGVLTIVWVVLVLVATLPMLFAEAALLPMRHAERPEARRVRAAAVSGLTLVIAATYGALFTYSADKVSWRADYSYFKTSRPSESTRKIAESLNEPLDVVAFFPQVSEVKTEVKAFLDELGRGVPNLKIEIQDRLLVPKRAKELKATQDGVIVLSKGSVTESLTIGVEEKNARPKLKTLDRDFQEKLLKIVRARRVAYLTVGHGELNDPSHGEGSERAAKIARTILQKQNYLIKDLGLSQGLGSEVPDDADVVLVLGPTEPFAREELASLERYGSRGGKLFIALDPDAVSWAEVAGEGAVPDAPVPPTSASGAPPKPVPSAAPGKPAPSGVPAKPAPSAATGKPAPSGVPPKPAPSAVPAKPAPSAAAGKPAPSGVPAKPAPSAATGKPAPSGVPPKPAPSAATGKPAPSAVPAKPAPSAAAAGSATPTAPPAEASKRVLPSGATGLVALGRIVGVEFSPVVLANDKQHVRRRYNDSDRTLLVSNRFSSHASVSTLSRNSARAAVGMFGSGSLERASGATEKVDFALKAVTGTFADENRNYRVDGAEKPGAFNLAAAVTRPRTGEPLKKKPPEPEKKPDAKKDQKSDPDEMRAFVLADADAVTDVVLANVVANQVLFADAVRWLGGEESFAGEVNTEEDVRIEHTKQKDLVWFYATIFGAPALILGAGLFFARRGKKKGGVA